MCPYESNCKYNRQLGEICAQKFICLFCTKIVCISDLMKFHVKHKLENLQLMWMTIASLEPKLFVHEKIGRQQA